MLADEVQRRAMEHILERTVKVTDIRKARFLRNLLHGVLR